MPLNAPPIQTSVDLKIGTDPGLQVSVPWSQWFQNVFSTLAGVLSALTSPIPSPIPVTLTGEQMDELMELNENVRVMAVELKLLNMHLHELPRALNEGYPYTDEDDVNLRHEIQQEL